VNTITRALAALATVALLSVDDIETKGTTMTMSKPVSLDPVEWARWNESQARTMAALSGLPEPEPGVLDIAPYEINPRAVAAEPLAELLTSVRRAADELHGTSAKGDRIALQLVNAMARFHAETETP
jgi:hypothetical protein